MIVDEQSISQEHETEDMFASLKLRNDIVYNLNIKNVYCL